MAGLSKTLVPRLSYEGPKPEFPTKSKALEQYNGLSEKEKFAYGAGAAIVIGGVGYVITSDGKVEQK